MRKFGAVVAAALAVAGNAWGDTGSRVRPARIPAGARVLRLTDWRPSQTAFTLTLTGRRQVRRIARLIDRLPPARRGVYSCPADRGPVLTFEFLARRDGQALAQATADGSGCNIVEVTIGGRREPPRSGGRQLIEKVGTLVALSF